jgi:hypothetical protein
MKVFVLESILKLGEEVSVPLEVEGTGDTVRFEIPLLI